MNTPETKSTTAQAAGSVRNDLVRLERELRFAQSAVRILGEKKSADLMESARCYLVAARNAIRESPNPKPPRCDSCAPEFGCWDGSDRCQKIPAATSAPSAGSEFLSPSEHGRYWHDLAQERIAEVARLRDALIAARRQILERNGLCRDSDRAAAIAINRALSPNTDYPTPVVITAADPSTA